ncbi:SIMPL domain-containing protein [Guggenheimella bovis]
MKTIEISVTRSIEKSPDTMFLALTMIERNKLYQDGSSAIEKRVKKLQELLKGEPLTIRSFRVNEEYTYEENKEIFSGYAFRYELSLAFPYDREKLDSILTCIQESGVDVTMALSFGLKDTESIQEELLKSLAVDAKKKATLLLEASGKKLGEVQSIEYLNAAPSHRYESMKMLSASSIDPEDISYSESATFVFEIL